MNEYNGEELAFLHEAGNGVIQTANNNFIITNEHFLDDVLLSLLYGGHFCDADQMMKGHESIPLSDLLQERFIRLSSGNCFYENIYELTKTHLGYTPITTMLNARHYQMAHETIVHLLNRESFLSLDSFASTHIGVIYDLYHDGHISNNVANMFGRRYQHDDLVQRTIEGCDEDWIANQLDLFDEGEEIPFDVPESREITSSSADHR